jgi:hypothetical protein
MIIYIKKIWSFSSKSVFHNINIVIIWIITMYNQSHDDTIDLLKEFLPDVTILSSRLSKNSEIKLSQICKTSMQHAHKMSWRRSSTKHKKSFKRLLQHWNNNSNNLKHKKNMSFSSNFKNYNKVMSKKRKPNWHKHSKSFYKNILMIALWLISRWCS